MLERIASYLRAFAEKDGRGYPDWAVRYVPLVRRFRQLDIEGKTIVEIGANENGFARFSRAVTVAIDLNIAHLEAARATQHIRAVQADAAALPFADGTVAFCVCVDTIEHLPPPVREAALREIARVVPPDGHAVIAFPSGDAAERAEGAIQAAYRAYTGRTIRWMDEHREQGLPGAETIASALTRADAGRHRVARRKNASVMLWQWMWKILMCGWPGRGNALFQALLRLVTPLLCSVHCGACYRAVLWLEPVRPVPHKR